MVSGHTFGANITLAQKLTGIEKDILKQIRFTSDFGIHAASSNTKLSSSFCYNIDLVQGGYLEEKICFLIIIIVLFVIQGVKNLWSISPPLQLCLLMFGSHWFTQ
jgi:hypothetical protein